MPAPRTVLLNGVQYAIETKEYRHASRRTLRDSAAINGEPSDSLFDTGGAWARYRHSWHMGAGQELDDLGDENLSSFRYRTAYNFHVWTNGELRYQAEWYDSQSFSAGSASYPQIVAANNYAVASVGHQAMTCVHGTYTSPLWSAVTGLSGTITSLATDGTQFFIGTTSNVYTLAAGATAASSLSAGNADAVAFVANRLLVSNGNSLYEVSSAGTRTLVTTHFQTSFRWNVIFAIGSRIYIGGRSGTRSELYSLTVDSAGALARSAEAAPFQQGELVYEAVSYAGFGIILSNLGARFCQVGADGTLTYGPLVVPDIELHSPSYFGGLAVGGGYAWYGCELDNGKPCLVEMDLSRFTDTLKPAFTLVGRRASASDVTYERIAYVGNYNNDSTRKALIGVSTGGNRVGTFSINFSGTYPDAYVRTGLIRFGTIEEKVLVEFEMGFEALPAGSSVTAAVYDETDTLVATGTEATDGATSLTVGLGNTSVRACWVAITFSTADSSEDTRILYWRMRAYPVVPPVQEWIVPIIAHETVVMGEGEGAMVRQNPKTMRDAIEALWDSKAATTYVEGDASYAVRVEDFEIRPSKWSTDGKYFQPLILVRIVRV